MSLLDHLPDQDANPPPEAWICGVSAHAVSPIASTPVGVSTAERLTRWEAALVAQEGRLEAAQVTLATVREDMRAQRLQNDNTRRRLEERSRELDLQAHDLELRHQKLLVVARRVKELKAQVAAQTQAKEEQSAAVVQDARFAETQQQLQLHAYEKNRLAQLVCDLKRERDFLERRVETLELQAVDRSGQTRRMAVPSEDESSFDNVPKHLENVNATPTRVYPANWRMENPRLSTKVRQGLGNLWEYFTTPVDPTLPPIN